MATVAVGKKQYPAAGVQLRLEKGAGPVVCVRFGTDNPGWNTLSRWGFQLASGTVTVGSTALDFLTIGPHEGVSPNGSARTLELIGLVLPKDLAEWFGEHAAPGGGPDTLVYQRKQTDEGVWPFLRRACGYRVKLPPDPDPLHLVAPGGCLSRDASWKNLQFVDLVVRWVGSRQTGVFGWRAVAADTDPIRLITANAPVVSLGSTWGRASGPLSHPLAGRTQPCVLRSELESSAPGSFFRALASGHDPEAVVKVGKLRSAGAVIVAPGPVALQGRGSFARAVTYSILDTSMPTRLTVEVELAPAFDSPPAELPPRELSGEFAAWADAAGGPRNRISLHPGEDRWQVIDDPDSGPDPSLPLLAQALVPKVRRSGGEEHAGIYVAHRDGDPMTFVLHYGCVPMVLGSPQIMIEPYEAADITLYGSRVSVDVSLKPTAADKMNGLHLDGKQKLAVLRFEPGGSVVTVDGENGRVEVAATTGFMAHSGEGASGKKVGANRLTLDGKAGKVHVAAKTAADLAVSGDPQVVVASDRVRMMKNVTVRDENTTILKDVALKGNLDMS